MYEWIRRLKTEHVLTACSLLVILYFIGSYLPIDLFRRTPSTGGDTGSHFWPLVTLFEHSLPHGILRPWNPGNLAGEPQLVHYFPLPFLIMSGFGLFVPLGAAFNIGTILPLILLPFSAAVCASLLRWPFPAAVFSALGCLFFIFNESYSMWGGNTLSTLAGQFAHAYALNFLLLGIGMYVHELRNEETPIVSGALFGFVSLSHAYVYLLVPFFLLSGVLLVSFGSIWKRLPIAIYAGLFSLGVSAWFLIPMITNSPWTTAMPMVWNSGKLLEEILPQIFYPVLILLIILPVALWSMRKFTPASPQKSVGAEMGFWLIPILASLGGYFSFTQLGLVDIRTIPQIQLFCCLLTAYLLGELFHCIPHRNVQRILLLPLVFVSLAWLEPHIEKFPNWAKWNYSGWETKPVYPDLAKLSSHLKGSFSDPRIVYEHSARNGAAGTERVFEMLPYFAGRATLESLYTQANIFSPIAYEVQAEVSKTPSCPLIQFKCSEMKIPQLEEKFSLLGVGGLILVSEEAITQAEGSDFIVKDGEFGFWNYYALKNQPKLVEVLATPPKPVADDSLKAELHKWYKEFDGTQPLPFAHGTLAVDLAKRVAKDGWDPLLAPENSCSPQLEVKINQIKLRTDCPGKLHLIKFAYHPTFETSDGQRPLLLGPGFMGVIPKGSETVLIFGVSSWWQLANLLSITTVVVMFMALILRKLRRHEKD